MLWLLGQDIRGPQAVLSTALRSFFIFFFFYETSRTYFFIFSMLPCIDLEPHSSSSLRTIVAFSFFLFFSILRPMGKNTSTYQIRTYVVFRFNPRSRCNRVADRSRDWKLPCCRMEGNIPLRVCVVVPWRQGFFVSGNARAFDSSQNQEFSTLNL